MFYRTLVASDVIRTSDEDISSQMNHLWSSFLIGAMAVLITMVQYVGDPIQCLCPASMPEVHCNYTKALCWIKESYFNDENDGASLSEVTKQETRMAYYPWSPWILFLMAVTLKLPHVVWCSFAPQSDLDLNKLVYLADSEEDLDNLAKVIRIWLIRTKRNYTDVFHATKRILSLLGFFWFGRHKRTFLTGLTVCVKFTYLVVSICLFYSLNLFLDDDFTAYGWDAFKDFLHGIPQVSTKFPRQIICTVKVRQMSNVNKFSIQCILPINYFNQKIFVFLWFWFIFLSVINAYSLIRWAFKLLSPHKRWDFVHGYILVLSHLDRQEKRLRKERQRQRKRDLNSNRILTHVGDGDGGGGGGGDGGGGDVQDGGGGGSGGTGGANNNIPNGGTISIGENNGLVLNLDSNFIDNAAADNIRVRRGSARSFCTGDVVLLRPKGKKKKRKKKKAGLTSIEMDQDELNGSVLKRGVNESTCIMMKHLGHDGVLIFIILETAVGVVIANQIFHKLHDQIMAAVHHSDT